eukprot:scaffold34860_cov58-Cyclotella_meneghiniana.AAC.1
MQCLVKGYGHKNSIRPPLHGVTGVSEGHTDTRGITRGHGVTGSSEAKSLYDEWLNRGHGVKNGRLDSLRGGFFTPYASLPRLMEA